MRENVFEFRRIEKSFFGVPVLRAVSFALRAGHVAGLIGENGAGKSTLMNILGGVLPVGGGAMLLDGEPYKPASPSDAQDCGIAFIHQELNLFTNLSVAENIFINSFPNRKFSPLIDRREMRQKTRVVLEAVDLQISPDTLVESLSPGERQLIEIAKALSINARIIIFDEPTSSLTAKESERLFGIIRRLRAGGISMIYISHSLGDVLNLCDEIIVLRDGAVVGAGARDEFSVEKMVTLMVGRPLEQLYPERAGGPLDEKALVVKNISQPGVVKDISFELLKGEVLGVSGLMGSGRTELARILFGLDPYESGEIRSGGGAPQQPSPRTSIKKGMAFLTENRREEGLLMDSTVAENVALSTLSSFAGRWTRLINANRLRRSVAEIVAAVRLRAADVERQKVQSLSGGNQQKVVLGKWLMASPGVFILDEPTRGIDVGAKHEIYRLINKLADGGAGVLIISSEMEELMGICQRILVMNKGEIVHTLAREDFDREKILALSLHARSH